MKSEDVPAAGMTFVSPLSEGSAASETGEIGAPRAKPARGVGLSRLGAIWGKVHWRRAWQLVGLFLLVAGARFWLVQTYSNELPFWDQWDGEGGELLLPYLEGHLTWSLMFAPHNEHRIVLTRLLVLLLFAMNGQWDAQLEMTVNATLCGVTAVLMCLAAFPVFPGRFEWPVLLSVALFFVLPFSWENTLAGFQSQFYFLLLCSLAAIWGAGLHEPGSGAWWIGILGLVLASLSMASGFLAAIAVLGLDACRRVKERTWPGLGGSISWMLCLIVVLAAMKTKVEVPGHAILKVESGAAFVAAVGRCLAWPFYTQPALAILMQAPLAALAIAYFWPRKTWGKVPARGIELLLAVGGWCLIQAAAVAYARGGHAALPASRYMDLLALSTVVNFLALLSFCAQPAARTVRIAVSTAATVWMSLACFGLLELTEQDFSVDLVNRQEIMRTEEHNVKGYLYTGDAAKFLEGKALLDIPFPIEPYLKTMLDNPEIRRILPADARLPAAVDPLPGNGENAAFVPSGFYPPVGPPEFEKTWGSYTAAGDASEGVWRGHFISPPAFPYLRIEFSGYLGDAGLSFELEDETAHRRAGFRPAAPAQEHWHADYVPVPRPGHDLMIVATDQSPSRWFAFSEPVEVGRLSYWAGYLVRRGGYIFEAGLLILGFLLLQGILLSLGASPEAPAGEDSGAAGGI